MATIPDYAPFDIPEQLARIDKMRAETLKLQEELQQVVAETLRAQREALKLERETRKVEQEAAKLERETRKVEQETRLAPWTIGFAGLGTGAALIAAGAGLAKLLMH